MLPIPRKRFIGLACLAVLSACSNRKDKTVTNATMQGMSMTCPPGWQDKSMLILGAERPGSSGLTANLVVTREAAAADLPSGAAERLEAFVDRQLAQMQGSLSQFKQTARRHATTARTVAELEIDWVSDGVPVSQWIRYANLNAGTLIVATATAGRSDFAGLEPVFRTMLQSLRVG